MLKAGVCEAGQFAAPAVAQRAVQIDGLVRSGPQDLVGDIENRLVVIAEHGIDIRSSDVAVEQKDGDSVRGGVQIVVSVVGVLHEIGSHKEDGVHVARQKELEILLLFFKLVACAAEHGSVSVVAQFPLQIVDCLRQIDIGRVRAHNSHGMHGIEPQASGESVRGIAVLLHDSENLPAGLLADFAAVVQNPGYGCD